MTADAQPEPKQPRRRGELQKLEVLPTISAPKKTIKPLRYDRDEAGKRTFVKPEDGATLTEQQTALTGTNDVWGGGLILRTLSSMFPSDLELNGALAIITELKPADPLEGMLLAQAVTTHHLAMRQMQTACTAKDMTLKQAEHAHNTAAKMMRLFMDQVQALTKYRNRGKQRIVIEHFTNNGQAILGDVSQGGG